MIPLSPLSLRLLTGWHAAVKASGVTMEEARHALGIRP